MALRNLPAHFSTTNKSRCRCCPPSIVNVPHRRGEESERAVAAPTARALEIDFVVPRGFNLYVSPLCLSQNAEPIE